MTSKDGAARRAAVSAPLETAAVVPLSSRVVLEIGAASFRGTLRPHNTDHYLAIRISRALKTLTTSLEQADYPAAFEEHGYAMFVADGIGSHGEGARASRVALSSLAYLAIAHGRWNVRVERDGPDDIRRRVPFFFHRVDKAVREAGREFRDTGLATSLTMVAVAGNHLFFTSVGHSKAYLFRAGRLIQLTTDHTWDRQRDGAMPPNESQHMKRDADHIVTKTIGGGRGAASVDIEQLDLVSGDRLLLCTNGLTDGASDDEIADALAVRRSPDEDCRELVDLAAVNGSHDDITAMVANYTLRERP